MTSYEETLQIIYGLKGSTTRNKVEDVRTVCKELNNPQDCFKIIHITGTNGKGTVSRQTAAVLIAEGYKTGLIISPHILSFRERISVNFEFIPEHAVIEKFAQVVEAFERIGLSYSFEQVVFIMGILYLRDCNVEYAVIEVGCGGTRDSSNVVDPVVSVITSVGLDHCHILGDTIELIAIEKSGVIKPGKPCVIGPNTPQELLTKIAEEKGSLALIVEKQENNHFLAENSRITRKVFEVIQVTNEALEAGLLHSQPFRCQRVDHNGLNIILDVGHNAMALNRVFADLKKMYNKPLRILLAISIGRDPFVFIKTAFEYSDNVHAVSCEHIRMEKHKKLVEAAEAQGYIIQESGDIAEILPIALEKAKDETVLIIGSCFIIEFAVLSLNRLGIDVKTSWV